MNKLDQIIQENNLKLDYQPMSKDQTFTFLNLTFAKIYNVKALDSIFDEMNNGRTVLSILNKRLEAYHLTDKIDKHALILLDIFANGNPGVGMFGLIHLLNHADDKGGQITMGDFSLRVYPYGFPTRESIMDVVDNLIKTRMVPYSEIYLLTLLLNLLQI